MSLPTHHPAGNNAHAATTARAAPWVDVPDAQWNDWRWQLANRINTYEEFARFIKLTHSESERAERRPDKFRVDITPYFASLIDPMIRSARCACR